MEAKAISILDAHRTMAIATVRPDGWPQNTIVGYANDGLLIYFLVSRTSQKLLNTEHDDRVALAIGHEPDHFNELKAVYAGGRASEVEDPEQRELAWQLLNQRHPNLADFELPDRSDAALMCATCRYISILDYSKGLGHTDAMTVGVDGKTTTDLGRKEDWGFSQARGGEGVNAS